MRWRRAATSATTKADSSVGDRPVSVEDAMAKANVGGANAGELQRHYAFIEQTKQPAQRADEALRLIGPPVHGLGPGERGNFLGQ